jgi:hypothetical protein
MHRSVPRTGLVVSLAIAGVLATRSARAAAVTFSVDPAQSNLKLTGSWDGANLWQRPVNSLVTSYGGSISADITGDSIRVIQASLDAETSGNYRPRAEGKVGRAAGDYGGFFRTGVSGVRGNLNVALRELVLGMQSEALSLTGGSFDASSLGLAATGGGLDYSGAGLLRAIVGKGRAPLAGEAASVLGLTGSLAGDEIARTLTIPVHATLRVQLNTPLPDEYDVIDLTLTGRIVATGAFIQTMNPEPASLSLLLLGATALCRRPRR